MVNFNNLSRRLLNELPVEDIALKTGRQSPEVLKELDAGPIIGGFKRRANIPEEMQRENVAAVRRTTAEEAILERDVNKTVAKSTAEDHRQFKELVEQEQHANDGYGAWTDPLDLALMPISKQAKELHQVWKDINDLDYITQNESLKRDVEREGFSSSTSGLITKNVDEGIFNTTGYSGMEIYVPEQKKTINAVSHSADMIKKEYINKGYKLYELHPISIANDDLNYNYILSREDSKFNKPLSDFLMPYAEGGIREYQNGTYFVKTPRLVYGNGKTYFGSSKTLIAGDDTIKLQQYADEVGQALDIYKNAKGNIPMMQKALDEVEFTQFKVDSAQDLFDLVRSPENPKGILDTNFKPGVYRHGEKPLNDTAYPELSTSSTMDTARIELSKLNNRYYMSRGKILANINSNQSILEDPMKIMERSIQRIAYERNIEKLLDTYGEYFKNNFADVVDTSQGLNPMNVSGKYLLMRANLKPSKEVAVRDRWKLRSAAHLQHIANSIAGTPTNADKKIIQYWNEGIDTLQDWWNIRALEALKNKNPARVAQSVMFHVYLGFANASMLWKQPLQIINMATLQPLATERAIASLPAALTAYLLRDEKSISSKLLKGLIQKVTRALGGLSADDLEIFVEYMKNYGTFHQLVKRPELVGTNLYLKQLKGIHKLSTMFYEVGNDISYLVGDLAAFTLVENKRNFKEVARIADDLNFNMSSANISPLQRNPLGALLTNLLSYPMGVLSAMTGKQFTGRQKAQFIIATLAMWGVAGTFDRDGEPSLFDFLNTHTELTPDQINLALNGLVTSLAAEFGYDVREGPDTLGAFKSVWDAISYVTDRNSEAPDIPVRGTVPFIVDTYKLIKDLINPSTNGNDLLYWLRSINDRKGLPTSVRTYSRTMYALAEKKILDKYGNIIKEDLSKRDITLLSLGIRPIEEKRLNSVRALDVLYRESIDDYVTAFVKPAADRYTEYYHTNKEYSLEEWEEMKNAVSNSIAAGREWIEEFRPEYIEYYNNRVNSILEAGAKSENKLSRFQKAIYYNLTINNGR